MSEQLIAWIRRVAALNDLDLEEELKLVNKNSLNAFARANGRIRRPELDTEIERLKHIPTQIQSIYCFPLVSLHYLPSIQKRRSALFHMESVLTWMSTLESRSYVCLLHFALDNYSQ
jgi:hypothetical protein